MRRKTATSAFVFARTASRVLAPLTLAACSGRQSALDTAGREAERVAALFWWMTAGAVVVWLAVLGLTVYASFFARELRTPKQGRLLIIVGGVVVPTVVLAGLLVYGLVLLRSLLAPAPEGSLKIHVTGHQWWWRVRYLPPGSEPVDLANEVRLPVGEPVEFELDSRDVIHSFWIPALAGKVDMIPGRRTRLRLLPTRTGTFRGVCAEYCGTSHALMAFRVVVQEKDEFARWLAQQAEPARPPTAPPATQGRELFLANGCGACHTVRGTPADGVVGPDLTHVGGRLSVGAGVLDNEAESLRRWIAHADVVKPGVHMPAFHMLPPEELRALASYLEGLK